MTSHDDGDDTIYCALSICQALLEDLDLSHLHLILSSLQTHEVEIVILLHVIDKQIEFQRGVSFPKITS
jgi:hypothetical protein